MKRWYLTLDYKISRFLCGVFGRWENKLWRRLYTGKRYKDEDGKWLITR